MKQSSGCLHSGGSNATAILLYWLKVFVSEHDVMTQPILTREYFSAGSIAPWQFTVSNASSVTTPFTIIYTDTSKNVTYPDISTLGNSTFSGSDDVPVSVSVDGVDQNLNFAFLPNPVVVPLPDESRFEISVNDPDFQSFQQYPTSTENNWTSTDNPSYLIGNAPVINFTWTTVHGVISEPMLLRVHHVIRINNDVDNNLSVLFLTPESFDKKYIDIFVCSVPTEYNSATELWNVPLTNLPNGTYSPAPRITTNVYECIYTTAPFVVTDTFDVSFTNLFTSATPNGPWMAELHPSGSYLPNTKVFAGGTELQESGSFLYSSVHPIPSELTVMCNQYPVVFDVLQGPQVIINTALDQFEITATGPPGTIYGNDDQQLSSNTLSGSSPLTSVYSLVDGTGVISESTTLRQDYTVNLRTLFKEAMLPFQQHSLV